MTQKKEENRSFFVRTLTEQNNSDFLLFVTLIKFMQD